VEIIKLLLSTIFFLAFIYLNASYDADRIKSGKLINHYDESSIRFIIMCCLSYLTVYTIKVKHTETILFIYFTFVLYFASLFWLLFDYLLNNLRDLHWDYISTDTSKKSSNIDKFFKELFGTNDIAHVMLVSKLVLFISVLMLVIYIIPHTL